MEIKRSVGGHSSTISVFLPVLMDANGKVSTPVPKSKQLSGVISNDAVPMKRTETPDKLKGRSSLSSQVEYSPAITTTPVTTTRRNMETNVRVHQITSANGPPGSPDISVTGGRSTTSSVTIKNLASNALDTDRIVIARHSMANGRVVQTRESQQIPSRLPIPPQSSATKTLPHESSLVLSDVSSSETDDENQNNADSPRDDEEEDPRGEPQNAFVSLDDYEHQGQMQRQSNAEDDAGEFHGGEAQRVYSRELTRENFRFFSQQEEAEEDPEQVHMHSPVLPPHYPSSCSLLQSTTSEVDHLLHLVTSALATTSTTTTTISSFLPSLGASTSDRQYVTLPASHLRQIQEYLETLKHQQPQY